MTQSMPKVAAVTVSLSFSREELVVTDPGTLGHRMGRGALYVLFGQLAGP